MNRYMKIVIFCYHSTFPQDQTVWKNPSLSDNAKVFLLGGVLMMGSAGSLYTEDAVEMIITSGVSQNVKGNVVITS